MKHSLFLSAACALVFAGPAGAANLLVDPGFESPITTDGAPFIGTWEGFAGAGASAANSAAIVRGGVQSLRLAIEATNESFAGAFQDVAGLTPGDAATVSGWFTTTSSPFGAGVEIRVEWRNSVANTEVSRTPNLAPTPTSVFSEFTLNSTVPAGADTARVVFAVQTFGPEPSNTGVVYFDDVAFSVVPEPTGALTASLALGGLLLRRRRHARD